MNSRRDFLKVSALSTLAASFPINLAKAEYKRLNKSDKPSRKQFNFLHTYKATGQYYKGIQKAGLVRPTTGIRLVHSPFGDDKPRFNNSAKIGGEFHKLIKEKKCKLVVDRIVGGSPHHVYDFDKKLVQEYATLLGDQFLGGQVHETMSNTNNDWRRITNADKSFNKEPFDPEKVRDFFTWTTPKNWLSYGVLDDYKGRLRPHSAASHWKELEWNAKRQANRMNGHFIYCEGSGYGEFAWHQFYKMGANYCMAEVGPWASYDSQYFIASLRGTATAYNKPWGIYFAPWGPNGCTSHIPLSQASWNLNPDFQERTNWPVGPDKGPSSALQRRSFFHAYMSGAHVLYEEWGAEDNLTNWEKGTLSCYGRVTKDLLDFQDANPDIGEPYTPLALVQSVNNLSYSNPHWKDIKNGVRKYSPEDERLSKLPGSGKGEHRCYSPAIIPEVFDIVPSDSPDHVWERYQEVILLGTLQAPSVAKRHPKEIQLKEIVAAALKLSPIIKGTNMPMQINHRQSDNAWIVAIYNPFGAVRGDAENIGSILQNKCSQKDALKPKFPLKTVKVLHSWPENSGATKNGKEIDITVGAGGTLILEIHEA